MNIMRKRPITPNYEKTWTNDKNKNRQKAPPDAEH